MIRLPHLETNVTIACQNRCVSCNHFVPLQLDHIRESMISPEVLERDLRNFGRVAHVEAWAAIGGEPTLHPDLVGLLAVARRSGVADRTEVWSNGQRLERMPAAFWSAFDVLVVSAYPGKIDDEEIEWIKGRCLMHGLHLELKDERHYPNFSRLLAPTTGAETREKFAACWFKTYSRVLDAGYFYACCTSPFIAPLLLGKPWGFDGLAVDETLTEGRLRAFLERREPLAGCGPCAGRNTRWSTPQPWSEERQPERWLEASAL